MTLSKQLNFIKYFWIVALIVVTTSSSYALPISKLKLVTEERCMFGDSDLVTREFLRSAALGQRSDRLLIQIEDLDTKQLIFNQELINLSQPTVYDLKTVEQTKVVEFLKSNKANDISIKSIYNLASLADLKDDYLSIFEDDGLTLEISEDLKNSYAISICKTKNEKIRCSSIAPESFDVMFNRHLAKASKKDKQEVLADRLYYYSELSPLQPQTKLIKSSDQGVANQLESLPAKISEETLIVQLPYYAANKCSLPK